MGGIGVTTNQNSRQRDNSKLITLNHPDLDLEWMEMRTFILFGLLYLSILTPGGSPKRIFIAFILSYQGTKTTLVASRKEVRNYLQGRQVENYSTGQFLRKIMNKRRSQVSGGVVQEF